MAIPNHVRAQLPKAKLLSVEIWRLRSWRIFTNRGANWRGISIGPLRIECRASWLEGPARALYPELFGCLRQEPKP